MICVTVAERSVDRCLAALKDLSFAEVRLDAMDVEPRDMRPIFSCARTLVATCRPGRFNGDKRRELLLASIEEGASFVDVEIDSGEKHRESIVEKARLKGCKVIVSFHDYEKTPEREELLGIVARCFEFGADVAKIACRVNSVKDTARLIGLLDSPTPVVVIGMGPEGGITRVIAPLLGSPFTYGAIEKGREVVDGQLDYSAIERALKCLVRETSGSGLNPGKKGGRKD
jgi:3-dehydroquinate dehydratase I